MHSFSYPTSRSVTPREATAILEEQGWIWLPAQTEGFLHEFLGLLGEVVYITDVTVNLASQALVTSDAALDLHTDHPTVNYIVWYCHRQCDEGGESLIADPLPAYLSLSPEHREALKRILLFQHRVFPTDPPHFPLVSEEEGKIRFYYSFWLVDEKDKNNPALPEFVANLKKIEPIRIKLQPGDILAVDNYRIFHGRSAIKGNKDRLLKRFWIMKQPKTLKGYDNHANSDAAG